MPFGYRNRITLIPGLLWLNVSKSGVSWSTKFGPLTHNSRRGNSLDLPGGAYWRQSRRKKGSR